MVGLVLETHLVQTFTVFDSLRFDMNMRDQLGCEYICHRIGLRTSR
jgi:hypothetical protein